MDTSNLQQPQFKTVFHLFNGKHYELPDYQRKFSWTKHEDTDLFNDINATLSKPNDLGKSHFFGSVVSYNDYNKKESTKIIDGQQRLTISLLTVAICRDIANELDKNFPTKRKNFNDKIGRKLDDILYRSNEILFFNGQSSLTQRESNLRDENTYRNYFNSIITGTYSGKMSANVRYRPLELLNEAYSLLSLKIRKLINKQSKIFRDRKDVNKNDGKILSLFNVFTSFVDNFYVVIMNTYNRSKALTIYVTLNNRGKALSLPDIIKGELAGVMEDNGKQKSIYKIMNEWNEISDKLDSNNKVISHFIWDYWRASHGSVHISELPRAISNNIKGPQKANDMVEELSRLVNLYETLHHPTLNNYMFNSKKFEIHIKMLNKLNLKQYYPLLLAIYHRKGRSKFCHSGKSISKLIDTINNIEMRRVVNHKHHTKYDKLSYEVWNKPKKYPNIKSIIDKINERISGDGDLNDHITIRNCNAYAHRLKENSNGKGMRTLLFILIKYYNYKYPKDFNDYQQVYNILFNTKKNDKHNLHVVHILNDYLDNGYRDFIGNFVILNNKEYQHYYHNNDLDELIRCMNSSKRDELFEFNKHLASELRSNFDEDYKEYNDKNKIAISNKFILNRQTDFAKTFVKIWK